MTASTSFVSRGVRGSGSVNGVRSCGGRNFNTSFSANRTTDYWKLNSSVNLNFRQNTYTLSDGEEIIDTEPCGVLPDRRKDVLARHIAAVFVAQQVLQQDLQRVGQSACMTLLDGIESIDLVLRAVNVKH